MEFKSFEELFMDETKNGVKIPTSGYLKKGKNIIVDQGQTKIAGFTDMEDGVFKEIPAILFGDHTRVIKYVDEPFFLGADGVKVLRGKEKNANYKYLYYALKNIKIPNTGYNRHFKWLKEAKLRYPDNNTQEKIVNILDELTYIIQKRNEEIKLLDNLIKARFIEMFGDPIINTKKWDECTIGELTTDVRYGTSKPSVNGGKYPYLRMNNLTSNGGLDLSDLKYIDVSDDEKEKCVVRKGDVLFNRTNSIDLVGKTAMFNLNEEMIIAGYIIRIRLNNRLLPEILSYYMNSSALKKLLRKMAKGAVNQANINAQELQSIKVYVPDLELQKEFISFVQQVDKSKFHFFFVNKNDIRRYRLLLNHESYESHYQFHRSYLSASF